MSPPGPTRDERHGRSTGSAERSSGGPRRDDGTNASSGPTDGTRRRFVRTLGVTGALGAAGVVPVGAQDDEEAPPSPELLQVLNRLHTSVQLQWEPVSSAERYHVEVGDRSFYTPDEFADVESLDPETTYDVSVTAIDDADRESESATTTVTTAPATDSFPFSLELDVDPERTDEEGRPGVVISITDLPEDAALEGYQIYLESPDVGHTFTSVYDWQDDVTHLGSMQPLTFGLLGTHHEGRIKGTARRHPPTVDDEPIELVTVFHSEVESADDSIPFDVTPEAVVGLDSRDEVRAPWSIEAEGVDEWSFELERTSSIDPEAPPDVSFEDGRVVVSGAVEFGWSGCSSLAPRRIAYDDSERSVAVEVDEFDYRDLNGPPSPVDCEDVVERVAYELTVDLAPVPDRATVEEAFDGGASIVRHRDDPIGDLPPEVADYELTEGESLGPVEASEVEPTVSIDDGDYLVEGAIAYDSSSCGRVALQEIVRVDGEEGHVGVTISDGARADVEEGTDCTDDVTGARYELRLTEADDALLHRLTVTEDGLHETRTITYDRTTGLTLPPGVGDYEFRTDDDASADAVDSDPYVWTARHADGDRVLVEGTIALSSGSCNALRLSDVRWEEDGHLAVRVDDTLVELVDEPSDASAPTPECTTDAPPIDYTLELVVDSIPETVTAEEGRARDEDPDRRSTVDLPGTLRTELPDGVESIAVRLGDRAHGYAIEPPTPRVGFEDGEFVAANDFFTVGQVDCTVPAVVDAEFASDERRHFALHLDDVSARGVADEPCPDEGGSAKYAVSVAFTEDPPRTVHFTEGPDEDYSFVADRGHEPALADVVVDYDLEDDSLDEEPRTTPSVDIDDEQVVVEGGLTLGGSACRELALQSVTEEDGHLTVEVGQVYREHESPFGGCTLDLFGVGYHLTLDVAEEPDEVTVVEHGEADDGSVTVRQDDCVRLDTDDERRVCDLDGDGSYRDVDASGDLTSQDLQVFFQHQHREPWDSRTDLFDFDGDGTVGQPDVVDLFESL